MTKNGMPKFEEKCMLPSIKLTTQQEDLCSRLDVLNQRTIKGQELSKIFIGAIFATREENRSNPDWMAQSAHSLREILYQFKSMKTNIKWIDAFIIFGSVTAEDEKLAETVGRVYNKITEVAHHQLDLCIEDYEKLIEEYERILLWALDRQVNIHDQIDMFLSENQPEKSGE
ncbi:MAG: hypothetical protein JXI43_06375 [Tissierellales bacterium]|nr:hypothetical protein [Tissierellales bacterium]